MSSVAQAIDPAVVGERLQRLAASVEALELALASQQRQIDALVSEVQSIRQDVLKQGARRPWTDDIRQLTNAIAEVDRKRVADSEQVVKLLNELRKSVSALAESSRNSPRAEGSSSRPRASSSSALADARDAYPYVMKRGETLSGVLQDFNAQAKKDGYRPLTARQVMEFNNIADDRSIQAGQTILLPLVPQ